MEALATVPTPHGDCHCARFFPSAEFASAAFPERDREAERESERERVRGREREGETMRAVRFPKICLEFFVYAAARQMGLLSGLVPHVGSARL